MSEERDLKYWDRIIIGIDPGTNVMGYGILGVKNKKPEMIAMGVIELSKFDSHYLRLSRIFQRVTGLIEQYLPDEMAIEELFFNTNITTGIAVAEARGVIICTAHKLGVKISEYTPLQVKQAVVGYGKAEKQQVISMVTALLKLPKPPKPDDTADALAIALCHSQCAGSAMGKYFNQRG